jgi:integrase/recombinase XerD
MLSIEELQRLFTPAKNPRHRVLLMTTYAAGLRVSEVVRLKLTDSDSERRLLRIEQGQGRKDRSTLLSPRLLTALRAYGHLYRPAPWVFTGRAPQRPMPIGTAQKLS